MRASFTVLSLSQGASFLFFHMPPFRSLRAVESRWCEQGRVTRSRRRPDERRQVETASKRGSRSSSVISRSPSVKLFVTAPLQLSPKLVQSEVLQLVVAKPNRQMSYSAHSVNAEI